MTSAVLEQTQAANATSEQKNFRMVDDVKVTISYVHADDAPVTDREIRAYIERGNLKNPNTIVEGLDLLVDGEDIEIAYSLAPVPFDRIRRITGYLVGTMDRWNNAKASEEHDRVKHSVPSSCSCCE